MSEPTRIQVAVYVITEDRVVSAQRTMTQEQIDKVAWISSPEEAVADAAAFAYREIKQGMAADE